MLSYIVLYRDETLQPLDEPYVFKCRAEDTDHAEEQLLNAEPSADIVWFFQGEDSEAAYAKYYTAEIN